MPLDIRLGDEDPTKLRNLSGEAFWQLVRDSGEVPSTAAPSPGAFCEAWQELKRRGFDAAITITISAELSATHQAAVAAARESPIPVSVIDSRNVTAGQGLLVLDALALAEAGRSLAEASRDLESEREAIRTIGTLDTLDYLRRGGRIGGAQAFFGAMLSIKPIVEVRDGRVEGIARERTRRRSLAWLVQAAIEAAPLHRLAVVHALAEDIDEFVQRLDGIACEEATVVSLMGPVVGAHTGIGTIGIAYCPVKQKVS